MFNRLQVTWYLQPKVFKVKPALGEERGIQGKMK
jgi:hypothetical protein